MKASHRIWACVLGSLLAAACSSGPSAGITTEVVSLAQGEFYALSWSGTQLERFYVMAHSGTPQNPSGRVMIISPDNAEPCELQGDDSTRYLRPLQPRTAGKYVVGWPSPARVFLFDGVDEDRVGTLRFTDIHCKPLDFEIPDVRDFWYLLSPDQTELHMAVRRRDLALEIVDPWKEERREVAQSVSDLQVYGTGENLIENHRLVQRDRKGKELLRRGKNVVSMWQLGGEGDVAYRDGTALWLRRDGADKRLADDGCDAGTLDQFISNAVVFNSPCSADAAKVLHVANGDSVYKYKPGVTTLFTEPGLMLFTTNEGDKTLLWLVRNTAPEDMQMVAEVPRCSFQDVGSLGNNKLYLKAQQPDKTLTVWQLELGPKPVLTELAQGLLRLDATSNAYAILQGNGDLLITNRLDAKNVSLRVPNAKSSDFGFVFSGKTAAVAYLSDVQDDTGLGRLELHFLSGQHFVIAPDVREWHGVWWPERGILYATGGEKPGISFARIEIPCESASDTAWACGF